MPECVYVCVSLNAYLYVCVSPFVDLYVYVCISVSVCMCIYVSVWVCVFACEHVCICVYIFMYACMCMCVCVPVYVCVFGKQDIVNTLQNSQGKIIFRTGELDQCLRALTSLVVDMGSVPITHIEAHNNL